MSVHLLRSSDRCASGELGPPCGKVGMRALEPFDTWAAGETFSQGNRERLKGTDDRILNNEQPLGPPHQN